MSNVVKLYLLYLKVVRLDGKTHKEEKGQEVKSETSRNSKAKLSSVNIWKD